MLPAYGAVAYFGPVVGEKGEKQLKHYNTRD